VPTIEASGLSVGAVVGSDVAIPENDGEAVKDGDALLLSVSVMNADEDGDVDKEKVDDEDAVKLVVALAHADTDGDALKLKDPLEHAESDGDAL
jgi:hypothetical protein